jgi:gamma-glutamyltranspeptidase/glutathione hydrolase
MPAMILKGGKPFLSFGVMGGDMQAQGQAQVIANVIDFGMDVQAAGEAPRFRHSGQELELESAISAEARTGLTKLGYHIVSAVDTYGGYQGIMIDPRSGALMGGSDPRKDGLAIGW